MDPSKGFFKVFERTVDRSASRYVYPHLLGAWSPYSWLLPRRFQLAEADLEPPRWPAGLERLRILLVSDIHAGPFLKPEALSPILDGLMRLAPDLVAIAGDIVTGNATDLDAFLGTLEVFERAPLGAYFCRGNHEYFTGEPEAVEERLESVGIRTLCNRSVVIRHAGGAFVLGGVDDRVLGRPDWGLVTAEHGPPHVVLAHNPDEFYEAEGRGAALVLSGHTHGGQIRPRGWPPIIRHSRFCLDEGLYAYGSGLLVVSRGLGVSGLPWRAGAHPEAVMLTVRSGGCGAS